MAAGIGGKNGIKFNNWNMVAKVLAYWQYDDSTNPGKDSHTWLDRWKKYAKPWQLRQVMTAENYD